MDKTYFISKKRHDNSSSGCTNRLLTMILILLSVQTLMFLVLAISIYSAYENHREDLHAIGDVPWGKMAHDFHNQYKRVNPTDISAILTNTRNMTQHGNNLLHRHIENILVDTETVIGEAKDNKDIFTQARGIMFKIRKPVDNIAKLVDDDAVVDIHETIKLLRDISKKIDDILFHWIIGFTRIWSVVYYQTPRKQKVDISISGIRWRVLNDDHLYAHFT